MVIVICEVGELFLAIYNPKNYFSWTVAGKNNPWFLSYVVFKQSECVTEDGCEETFLYRHWYNRLISLRFKSLPASKCI